MANGASKVLTASSHAPFRGLFRQRTFDGPSTLEALGDTSKPHAHDLCPFGHQASLATEGQWESARSEWIGDGRNDGTPMRHATMYRRRSNALLPRPLRQRLRDAVDGDPAIRSRVVVLLGVCAPCAVIGRVRAVVVQAVQRLSIWATSHVCEKGIERVTPPFAHGDASGSVPLISLRPWIVATRASATPSEPLRVVALETHDASSDASIWESAMPVVLRQRLRLAALRAALHSFGYALRSHWRLALLASAAGEGSAGVSALAGLAFILPPFQPNTSMRLSLEAR